MNDTPTPLEPCPLTWPEAWHWACRQAYDIERSAEWCLFDALMRAPKPAPAEPSREMDLRREWWLSHGKGHALYGDDGEMQCSTCGIDFKRWDAGSISAVRGRMKARPGITVRRCAVHDSAPFQFASPAVLVRMSRVSEQGTPRGRSSPESRGWAAQRQDGDRVHRGRAVSLLQNGGMRT